MVGRIQGVDIDQVVWETELTLANILVGKKYENVWPELEVPITSQDLLLYQLALDIDLLLILTCS
jgi:hypothetical protein